MRGRREGVEDAREEGGVGDAREEGGVEDAREDVREEGGRERANLDHTGPPGIPLVEEVMTEEGETEWVEDRVRKFRRRTHR